jgi:predicted RNase H-like HicB family nuclease
LQYGVEKSKNKNTNQDALDEFLLPLTILPFHGENLVTCYGEIRALLESKGYVSKCPELGVSSCGDTFDDAVQNLREAVELYLENAVVLGIIGDVEESLTAKEKYTAHLEAAVQ